MENKKSIEELLEQFQEGYTQRDLNQVDEFMQLFTENAIVIGTNGIQPGVEEWYTNRGTARALVHGDWEGWGDVKLLWDTLTIRQHADTGWFSISATVTQEITEKTYTGYLGFMNEFIEKAPMTDEQKLLYLIRGGANLLYEIGRGTSFEWPLRITGCVVLNDGGWQFDQMCFSFPAIYLPDVRNMPGEDVQWY
ncbi:MAG: nuclear transport factor 2 family protein [Anaerolineae bacterium]|jgi:hypothetical protein|nr:nuclear transport factor 2 family protein [Anaerolineae bacterium]